MKALSIITLLVVLFLSKYSVATSHHGCTPRPPADGFNVPDVPTDDSKWNPSNCEYDLCKDWVHILVSCTCIALQFFDHKLEIVVLTHGQCSVFPKL